MPHICYSFLVVWYPVPHVDVYCPLLMIISLYRCLLSIWFPVPLMLSIVLIPVGVYYTLLVSIILCWCLLYTVGVYCTLLVPTIPCWCLLYSVDVCYALLMSTVPCWHLLYPVDVCLTLLMFMPKLMMWKNLVGYQSVNDCNSPSWNWHTKPCTIAIGQPICGWEFLSQATIYGLY